ncbi:FAD-dependent oxidoreductase [Bacteriovorax sp. PP10]|uniref:FAD-dependent oxidoreductase n=1 Tax=Bacteriovorax antarcticus TaxID=3088717 RepID=A0ABU5VVU8_9BACT|nr:FAD-dependent oxidoreductase [Bacteriovorax sp. PP10]MEA9357189.1 FAD-dependent oxidoreductase [Bacteriovorax sp. PP10]
MSSYDVIVVGGGPGGCTTATYLALKGHKVLLIEKEVFPRFKIGESLLPFSMEVMKETGFYDVLSSGKYIQKNGAYFFDSVTNDNIYFDFANGGKAEFPHAYEVIRSEFDKDLLEYAQKKGVEVRQPEEFVNAEFSDTGVMVKTNKGIYHSKYIVDGSGRASIVTSPFQKKVKNPFYINNFAVFAHFEGVDRSYLKSEGDICVGILKNKAWSWTIPFKGNTTSVGIVSTQEFVVEMQQSEEFFDQRVADNPFFHQIMKNAKRTSPFMIQSNFSYANEKFVGNRWGTVGDAMSFLDPVFSSGVHVSLMSAKYLSTNIDFALRNGEIGLDDPANVHNYEELMKMGVGRFHNLLQIFYEGDFINKIRNIEGKEHSMGAMIAAVSGGMWRDSNSLMRFGIL